MTVTPIQVRNAANALVDVPMNDDPTTGAMMGAPNAAVPANDTDPATLNGRLQRIAQRLSTIIANGLGLRVGANPVAVANPLPTFVAGAQDPIYDHANGEFDTIPNTSTILFVPGGTCYFVEIDAESTILLTTDNTVVADDGKSIRIQANAPRVIPVTPGLALRAKAITGTAIVRTTPLKARP